MKDKIDGSRPQSLVSEFHRVYEMPNLVASRSAPSLDTDHLSMRMSLITEEFAELYGAVYGPDAEAAILDAAQAVPDDNNRDVVETADALADLVYVIYGMALECGIDLDAVLAEVQRSNLSKLMPDGSVKRREDGKVLKGPNFSPPDVAGVLTGLVTQDLRP
ncbi:pyrophosphohydrolase domain-containing protein [Scrofimicrobium canadense]|nr:phosphoribosyl-ATP diphosphatase [Scrofimicrobium canadense]